MRTSPKLKGEKDTWGVPDDAIKTPCTCASWLHSTIGRQLLPEAVTLQDAALPGWVTFSKCLQIQIHLSDMIEIIFLQTLIPAMGPRSLAAQFTVALATVCHQLKASTLSYVPWSLRWRKSYCNICIEWFNLVKKCSIRILCPLTLGKLTVKKTFPWLSIVRWMPATWKMLAKVFKISPPPIFS